MHNDIKVIDENRQGEPTMLQSSSENVSSKKLYLESYGCQMNFADSEIVASILKNEGFETTKDVNQADAVFINTCAIRDNAEQRVRTRLKDFKKIKKENPDLIVGVLGCMAERLKSQFLEEEKLVDIVVGPDAYRDLPLLIEKVEDGQKAVNVILSKEETYADITPVRLGNNGVTAFVSIMRGCDNMCSFCVVPFTRGRERSRDPQSIIKEVEQLFNDGYREVKDLDAETVHLALNHQLPSEQQKDFVTFSNLLEMVAEVNPDMRVRFSTSNPRDMTDAVLHSMAKYENICKYIHLPVQSGNSRVLQKMNRGYTREEYISRIESIKRILPSCGISTDIIAGFCSETEEEHQETISLMEQTIYDFAFMFVYSERPGTYAERKFEDDVLPEVKTKRLNEIVALQQKHSAIRTNMSIGKIFKVLIEGVSKKSDEMLMGRNSQNTVVVFPKNNHKPGEYVNVKVNKCTSTTLIGEVV